MGAKLRIGFGALWAVCGCGLMGYFDQAPECEVGETRTRAEACGVCGTGTLSEVCGPDRRWQPIEGDSCDDAYDHDHDGYPNTDCGAGVPVDCNDDDGSVFPGGTGLEECTAGASEACTMPCGTAGRRTCSSTCTWGGCELTDGCNGVDDDCDGLTDEDAECRPGETVACTTTCGSTGSGMCTVECLVPIGPACTPPGETCNGADDDCDGATDNGFPCVRGTAVDCVTACGSVGSALCTDACEVPSGTDCSTVRETCNGADDDCDTQVDEGFPCARGSAVPCTTRCGTTGSWRCTDTCTIPETTECTPPPEDCVNLVDDDCDGLTDERDPGQCTPGETVPCTTACGSTGTGICTTGCNPPTGSDCALPAESCNGVDDDCDGQTDEDFECVRGTTEPCDTACGTHGTRTCSPFCEWNPCTAREICNGCDDDADGFCDTGFPCCAGAAVACTTSCGTLGAGTCSAGCTPPLPRECTPPPEICNGRDGAHLWF
ncbi:MAG: MopE-related protein [Myxococcota bacterium]|nr:MopE-related protein [Myxococcota bacterium]